jgi:uncharacterized protein YndB with AHSA1/START domain
MPITSVKKDPETLTMTIVAEFAATVERVWDAYADPRQIEKFWGPVEWPATFTRHDFAVGGMSHYYMTGPDGENSGGYWRFTAVERYRSFSVVDGFAKESGAPNDEMPSMDMTFTFEAADAGARVTTVTTFPSLEALDELVAMGMEDGMRSAMSQIDGVLADLASFAAGRATEAEILSDTQVRVARVVRGTVDQVWRAHHDPDLMKRWLLGPDGWTMPVCEIAQHVGDTYRYFWEPEGGGEGFGFDGELLESMPPHRAVTTEHMTGTDYPSTTNEMTLTPVTGGTLLSIVITYPNAEMRDTVLATGMTDGMETSYARLESQLAGASA